MEVETSNAHRAIHSNFSYTMLDIIEPAISNNDQTKREMNAFDSTAAVNLQKVYRSFRTRRRLAHSAVIAEELRWQFLEFARLNHSTISFFDFLKLESASRWSRVSLNASKVGKGLSKDDKAQKLAFQHLIEPIDPRHRYGHRAVDYSAVRKILEQYPDSIKGVTPGARMTALHIAVRNNDLKMVEVLLEHLRGKFYYNGVVDVMDAHGKTVLHLAVARKQLQTIQMLLENGPADRLMLFVNAKNRGGFRALDILDVLPESGEVDMKIEKTLRSAGALSAREEAIRNKHDTELIEQKFDRNKEEVLIEFDESVHPPRSEPLANRNSVVVIFATMIATMTFHAALNPPIIIPYNVLKEEEAFWNPLFVLFNSVAFFTSVAFIVVLTHELPVKPWLHFSVCSAIGAYICIVMAVSSQELATVIFIGIFVFVGAVGKMLKVHKKMVRNMQWVCTRIHPI